MLKERSNKGKDKGKYINHRKLLGCPKAKGLSPFALQSSTEDKTFKYVHNDNKRKGKYTTTESAV